MTDNLVRLRRRLTAWYTITLGTIVVLLGAGLFVTVRQQISAQLDASLVSAADAIARSASIREAERASASGAVMDAVAELRLQDRTLYLFDDAARPVVPAVAPRAVSEAAARALRDSVRLVTLHPSDDHILRVYAERFRSRAGHTYAAVAVADTLELEDKYAALIVVFGGAALVALVLFAAVGSFLTRKSVAPVEQTMNYMRRFMADAAHELRTPLTVLRSRAEVALAAEPDPVREREALLAIEREAIRLGRIVEDLLLLARSDADAAPATMTRFFLDDVTSDAVSAAGAIAEKRGVALSLDRFDETPIYGDAALVRQLIMILLDNATKFTPAGGSVVVSVAAEPAGPVLRVADSGPGIPASQIEHVFERFYRGDAARSRTEGAGLGLSIAQWIADTHGARISLRSEAGTGLVALVRFPPAGKS